MLALARLSGDRGVNVVILIATATTLQRADLHPHRSNDPHEEQPQQQNDSVLESTEYGRVVGRPRNHSKIQMHMNSGACRHHDFSNRTSVVPTTLSSPSARGRS